MNGKGISNIIYKDIANDHCRGGLKGKVKTLNFLFNILIK